MMVFLMTASEIKNSHSGSLQPLNTCIFVFFFCVLVLWFSIASITIIAATCPIFHHEVVLFQVFCNLKCTTPSLFLQRLQLASSSSQLLTTSQLLCLKLPTSPLSKSQSMHHVLSCLASKRQFSDAWAVLWMTIGNNLTVKFVHHPVNNLSQQHGLDQLLCLTHVSQPQWPTNWQFEAIQPTVQP